MERQALVLALVLVLVTITLLGCAAAIGATTYFVLGENEEDEHLEPKYEGDKNYSTEYPLLATGQKVTEHIESGDDNDNSTENLTFASVQKKNEHNGPENDDDNDYSTQSPTSILPGTTFLASCENDCEARESEIECSDEESDFDDETNLSHTKNLSTNTVLNSSSLDRLFNEYLQTHLKKEVEKNVEKYIKNQEDAGKHKMSEAAVDLIERFNSTSSPWPSDKKKFAELSLGNMQDVVLHVNLDIAEELIAELPNDQMHEE